MESTNTFVMGLSLGTRCLGVVVRDGNELVEWRLHTFRGVWSPVKLRRITDFVIETIKVWKPERVLLKKIDPLRASYGLVELREYLDEKLQNFGITYSSKELPKEESSRSIIRPLIMRVQTAFPELATLQFTDTVGKRYNKPVFEAAQLTLL